MRSTGAAVIVIPGDVGQPLAFQRFTGRPLAANGGRILDFEGNDRIEYAPDASASASSSSSV